MLDYIEITSFRLFKCPKKTSLVGGQSLFIFVVHDYEFTGQPGPLTERQLVSPTRYVAEVMESCYLDNLQDDDDDFMNNVFVVVASLDISDNCQTVENLASEICCYIRSCYRFKVNVLSVLSKSSLVFVVEVTRVRASKDCCQNMTITTAKNSVMIDVDCGVDRLDDSSFSEDSSIYDEEMDDGYDSISVDDGVDISDDISYYDWRKYRKAREMVMKKVREWQELCDEVELKLEEVKLLVKYEKLDWSMIDNNYVINKSEAKRGECAICLESFAGKLRHNSIFTWLPESNTSFSVVRLCCRHSFHHQCIFNWLKSNPTCPLCRSINYVIV